MFILTKNLVCLESDLSLSYLFLQPTCVLLVSSRLGGPAQVTHPCGVRDAAEETVPRTEQGTCVNAAASLFATARTGQSSLPRLSLKMLLW